MKDHTNYPVGWTGEACHAELNSLVHIRFAHLKSQIIEDYKRGCSPEGISNHYQEIAKHFGFEVPPLGFIQQVIYDYVMENGI